MEQENFRRSLLSTDKNTEILDVIFDNIISSYKNELSWLQKVRQKLFDKKVKEERNTMNYQIREIENKKYIELISSAEPLKTENDALDLAALCSEHDTYMLMIHSAALSGFSISRQGGRKHDSKLINYGVRTANTSGGN